MRTTLCDICRQPTTWSPRWKVRIRERTFTYALDGEMLLRRRTLDVCGTCEDRIIEFVKTKREVPA